MLNVLNIRIDLQVFISTDILLKKQSFVDGMLIKIGNKNEYNERLNNA